MSYLWLLCLLYVLLCLLYRRCSCSIDVVIVFCCQCVLLLFYIDCVVCSTIICVDIVVCLVVVESWSYWCYYSCMILGFLLYICQYCRLIILLLYVSLIVLSTSLYSLPNYGGIEDLCRIVTLYSLQLSVDRGPWWRPDPPPTEVSSAGRPIHTYLR